MIYIANTLRIYYQSLLYVHIEERCQYINVIKKKLFYVEDFICDFTKYI